MTRKVIPSLLLPLLVAAPAAAQQDQDYVVQDGTVAYAPLETGAGTTLFTDSDDGFTAVTLPFSFKLYGKPYTRLWVSVNGAVSFQGVDTITNQVYPVPGVNSALPSAAKPNAMVAVLWRDWVAATDAPGGGSRVAWVVEGTAPERTFVIDWARLQPYGAVGATSPTYSFALRLKEGSDVYEQRVAAKAGTGGIALAATSGAENHLGGIAFKHLDCSPACTIEQATAAPGRLVLPNLNPELVLTLTLGGADSGGPKVDYFIENRGKAPVPSVAMNVYVSTDDKLDLGEGGDKLVFQMTPFALGSSASVDPNAPPSVRKSQAIQLESGSEPLVLGRRFLIGVVDPANTVSEINKLNNRSVTAAFIAGAELSCALTGQGSAVVGESATLSLKASNKGVRGATDVRYELKYESELLGVTPSVIASGVIPSLPALTDVTVPVTVNVPDTLFPGLYRITAAIDTNNATAEGDESNNAAPGAVEVEMRGPDVGVLDVRAGARVAYKTVAFPVRVTLENKGPAKAKDFTFSVYLSANDVITRADRKVFTSEPVSLDGNSQRTITQAAVVGNDAPPGTYYVGIIVDAEGKVLETDRSNNIRRGDDKLELAEPVPDLTVSSAHVQGTAAAGESVRFSALLANVGAADAEFEYLVVASSNAAISPADRELSRGVITLGDNEQQVLAVDAKIPGTLPAGTYTVGVLLDPTNAVTEANEANNNAVADSTLNVVEPALAIVTPALPDGVAGVPYDVRLLSRGGAGASTWRVAAGSLPSGLTLAADGRISGAPTSQGLSVVTLAAKSGAIEAYASFTITIRAYAASLGLLDARLPAARRGLPYTATIGASGGNPPYRFSLAAGASPAGLTLSEAGVLSGLPTEAGKFALAVAVEDNAGYRAIGSVAVDVLAEGALQIVNSRLREPEVGRPYTAAITIDGGLAPYTATVLSGALPPGLALLVDDNGTKLAIEGIPEQSGVFAFRVSVSDSRGERDAAQLLLRVSARTITFVTTQLPEAVRGQSYSARIESSAKEPARYSLVSGSLPKGLSFRDGLVSGVVAADADQRIHAFAIYVADAQGSEGTAAFSINIPAPKRAIIDTSASSCSSTGGGAFWMLALVPLVALRRRRALGVLGVAAVVLSATPAFAVYRVSRTSAPFTPITSGISIYTADDNFTARSTPLPIPFLFNFWGTTQSTVAVSTGGLLTFGATNTSVSNTKIPAVGDPSAFVAPFWDDLRLSKETSAGTGTLGASLVSWTVTGATPNRVFVVEWKNMQRNLASQAGAASSSYSFQVRLFETSNDIEIAYGGAGAAVGAAPTFTASIGVEATGGTAGIDLSDTKCSPACGTANFPNNSAIRLKLAPDLKLSSVVAPPSVFGSTEAVIRASLSNIGGADATNVKIRYLLSTDTLVDSTDILLGESTPTTVFAGGTTQISTRVVASPELPAGIYQLLSIVDPANTVVEVDEDNNAYEPIAVGVAPPAVDFTVTRAIGGGTATAGQAYRLTRTIKNVGNKEGTAKIRVVLSPNLAVSAADRVIESVDDVVLAAGAALDATVDVTIPADVVPGKYWIGVLVRPGDGVAELDSLNNDRTLGPITVRGDALAIDASGASTVAAGVPFLAQLKATGGQGEYRWSAGFPAPPTGVKLSEDGALTGVLDVPGEYRFKVQVLSLQTVVTAEITLNVVGQVTPLALISRRLPLGQMGAPYSAYLIAQGGKPPYAWAMADSSATPEGVVLGTDGAVEGVPATPGEATMQVKVTDSAGVSASGAVVLPVAGPAFPLLTSTLLPVARLGEAFTAQISAAGGVPPYRFSVVDARRYSAGIGDDVRTIIGGMPPGLELAEDGKVTGSPTLAGVYALGLRVVDTQSRDDSASLVLTITSGATFEIRTASLKDAVAGSSYDTQLVATGGTGKIAWSAHLVEGVSFPSGLAFTEEGRIVGFAGQVSDVAFLAVARDEAGNYASRAIALRVVDPPAVVQDTGCSQTGTVGLLALCGLALMLRRRRTAALLVGVLAGCTDPAPVTCEPACGAGYECDTLDQICKCGGPGGAICSGAETCDGETKSCLVATCTTSCPAPLVCGSDGACHCGTPTGPSCGAGESCNAFARCEKKAICLGVSCSAGMACDASNQGQCRCGPGGPVCTTSQRCVNGACVADKCLGVACSGSTRCDAADGICKCGGDGGAVCVNGEACDPVNARCTRTNRCDGVSCRTGETCDPANGECRCGGPGGPLCRGDQVCDTVAKQCFGGDLCAGVQCTDRTSCDPEDGLCKCGGVGGAVCGQGTSCVVKGAQARCETSCEVLTAACGAANACRFDSDMLFAYCVVAGERLRDDDCAAASCADGLHCVEDSTGVKTCKAYCRVDGDCGAGSICKPFTAATTVGTCARAQP